MSAASTSSVTIRPMRPKDERGVRQVYAVCHPGWPQEPEWYYFLNPTLVALNRSTVIGFTAFRLNMGPDNVLSLYGIDICVAPRHRGQGIGRRLHEARRALGHAAGATHFIGMARRDNAPMLAIFRSQGMRELVTVQGHYIYDTPPADGVAYIGETRHV